MERPIGVSETVVNTYGGSPLNRLSWLRTSHSFLNAAVERTDARWMLFKSGQPLLITSPVRTPDKSFTYLHTDDVRSLLGPQPWFGQGQKPGDSVTEEQIAAHKHSPLEALRHIGAPIVFLGVNESNRDVTKALPTSELKDPEVAVKKLQGAPFFALDVAEVGSEDDEVKEKLDGVLANLEESSTYTWAEPRSLMSTLDNFTAAVFANARSMLDWNLRNKFCPGCGSPTYSMWGGWKIACTSLLPWVDTATRKPCPSSVGLHNYTHPRTDAVVIMIAIDETGDRVLLGRGKRFPGNFYSALAGFIEPGESFEDAVVREMWEEAGMHVWNIRYHSGQPWPYPANLMVGFYARADSSKPIRVDLDNELVDARWFTREEVGAVLDHKAGTHFKKSDYKRMAEVVEGKATTDPEVTIETKTPGSPPLKYKQTPPESASGASENGEPPFRLPPLSAIAGVLIRDWVDGKIGFTPELTVKQNL